MKKYFKAILILTAVIGLGGCSGDYLEEIPDNRTTIDSPEKIKELLVNAYPTALYAHFTELMSDNAQDKGSGMGATTNSVDSYFWNETFQNVAQDSPEYFWTETFSNIAAANQALQAIEDLGISSKEMSALKAEARIARAYGHFMLVNLWGKHYDPATASQDLGIPIVTEPENVVFKDYERATVEEVYEFIGKELSEALPNLNDTYLNPQAKNYHFNIDAAHAFASRFYLYKGEWEKVIEHSNEVLRNNVANRLIDWNGARRTMTFGELNTTYTRPTNPANLLVTEASSWWGRNYAGERYGLTVNLRNQTLFAANPTGGSWAYRVFGTVNYQNVPKFDENFVPSTPGGNTGLGYTEFALFRLEEVLLNRAEAYVMVGNFAQAAADLNTFYSKRITDYNSEHIVTPEDIVEFYEQSPERLDGLNPSYSLSEPQEYFLQAIIDARRYDYMHEGLRWFDIRRFNIAIDHPHGSSSNIEEQESMFLPGDSPAHQLQIPPTAMSTLELNPR